MRTLFILHWQTNSLSCTDIETSILVYPLTQDYKSFPLQSVVLISANVCDAMRSIKLFPTKFLLIEISYNCNK